MRAPVDRVRIFIFAVPLNFSRELPALVSSCHDVHNKAAMIKGSSDPAIEPTEVLDIRAYPFACRTSYRGNQRHGVWRYADRATDKSLQLTSHVSAAPQPIFPWQTNGDARFAWSANHRRIVVRHCSRHLSRFQDNPSFEITSDALIFFFNQMLNSTIVAGSRTGFIARQATHSIDGRRLQRFLRHLQLFF